VNWKESVNAPQQDYNIALNTGDPYQKSDGVFWAYYTTINNQEYLVVWQSSYPLPPCVAYNEKKIGCNIVKEDWQWYVIIYDDGIKNEYGPYGFIASGKWETTELDIGESGFIFCTNNRAVVHKNGIESVYEEKDISSCRYSDNYFGFSYQPYAQDRNKRNVFINDKKYWPYDSIENLSITNRFWWFAGYTYEKDMFDYIINGNTLSGENIVSGPFLLDDYYAIAYERSGRLYMKIANK